MIHRSILIAALVFGLGAVGLPSAQASCRGSASYGSTWTEAHAGTCSAAQARIDRYVGGSTGVQVRVGGIGRISYISASNGIHSGNFVRFHSGVGWTAWTGFH